MSEAQVVDKTQKLNTHETMVDDLRKLGLYEGMTVIVHSSLSSLGWVCGGAVAVIQALMEVVTSDGTIVMPTHSGNYSEPSYWRNPPVPQEWWPIIRETMPAFNPAITPTNGMGVIPETFRKFPGVMRSNHSTLSFAAWGKEAQFVTEKRGMDFALGENSPLAAIYKLDGWVLLLGVGYSRNTSFHLAEYRAPHTTPCLCGAPIAENGIRSWRTYQDIDFDTDFFETIGAGMEAEIGIKGGLVGIADSKLFQQRIAVDYAVSVLRKRSQERG
jgi:aminoglycoside 3-N-acetyltransferase